MVHRGPGRPAEKRTSTTARPSAERRVTIAPSGAACWAAARAIADWLTPGECTRPGAGRVDAPQLLTDDRHRPQTQHQDDHECGQDNCCLCGDGAVIARPLRWRPSSPGHGQKLIVSARLRISFNILTTSSLVRIL